MPRKRTTVRIPRTCPTCGTAFTTIPSRVKEGKGKYCCHGCADVGMAAEARLRGLATADDPDLFWRRVRKTETCWLWMRATNTFGYGKTMVWAPAGRRIIDAHRRSWELTYGPIPAGLVILHRCDNPPCVRPDHLELGTQGDNIRDMVAKGRHWTSQYPERRRRGEQHPHAKVTEDDVRAIRARRADGEPLYRLADDYNVSVQLISRIARRTAWKHVT